MSQDGSNRTRRRFLTGATAVVGAVGVVGAAVPFIKSWVPSAKARAAGAPVKANIGKLERGAMMTVEWRGKPVYIVRRTPEVLEQLANQMRDFVADPDSEGDIRPEYVSGDARAIEGHEEFLVAVGLCTHLGCAPKYRPDVGAQDLGGDEWLGGFFCPCHGSKFDLSGRVYNNVPAPTNLEIPPYRFESDTLIVIGEDQGAA